MFDYIYWKEFLIFLVNMVLFLFALFGVGIGIYFIYHFFRVALNSKRDESGG